MKNLKVDRWALSLIGRIETLFKLKSIESTISHQMMVITIQVSVSSWIHIICNATIIKLNQFIIVEHPYILVINISILVSANWPNFTIPCNHYTDVIMGSMRLKLPASRLFTQAFIHTQSKEIIKASHHRPLCGEFSGDWWILRTTGQ